MITVNNQSWGSTNTAYAVSSTLQTFVDVYFPEMSKYLNIIHPLYLRMRGLWENFTEQ